MRLIHDERKSILQQAAKSFENFINLLDSYRILPANEVKTYERYQENPTSFSTAVSADAAVRRQTKIARFKEEKSLKDRVEVNKVRTPCSSINDLPNSVSPAQSPCFAQRRCRSSGSRFDGDITTNTTDFPTPRVNRSRTADLVACSAITTINSRTGSSRCAHTRSLHQSSIF